MFVIRLILLTAGGANGRTKRADETGRQSKEAAKFAVNSAKNGRLAQLVERLPYKERVRSSSLLTPTILEKEPSRALFSCFNSVSNQLFKTL